MPSMKDDAVEPMLMIQASDIRKLGELVRERVRLETGIELVFEIVFAGDWSGWQAASAESAT